MKNLNIIYRTAPIINLNILVMTAQDLFVLEFDPLTIPGYIPSLFTTRSRLLTLMRKSLLKTLWKKEKMLVTSIFSFSHNVFKGFYIQISIFQSHLFCRLQVLSIWTSLKICRLVKSEPITTQYHIFMHYRYVAVENIVRIVKLIVSSNFSFSHNVFYLLWHLIFILHAL